MNASANRPADPVIVGVGGRTTNGGDDISGVGDIEISAAVGGGVATVGGGDGDVSGLLLQLLETLDAVAGGGFTRIGDGTCCCWLLAPPPGALPPVRALGKENTPTDAIDGDGASIACSFPDEILTKFAHLPQETCSEIRIRRRKHDTRSRTRAHTDNDDDDDGDER